MEFKAGVQYGDWEGTAAADDGDEKSVERYLEDKGLIGKDEYLVAASLWVGENHDGRIGSISISAFIYAGDEPIEKVAEAIHAAARPIPVRVVELNLPLAGFVGLFKRFNVLLTWKGLQLEGREYEPTNRDT
jgi:hypothetical protein